MNAAGEGGSQTGSDTLELQSAQDAGYDMYADLQRSVVEATDEGAEDGLNGGSETHHRRISCPPVMGKELNLWPDVPSASQYAVPGGFRREFIGAPVDELDQLTDEVVRTGFHASFAGTVTTLVDDTELLLALMANAEFEDGDGYLTDEEEAGASVAQYDGSRRSRPGPVGAGGASQPLLAHRRRSRKNLSADAAQPEDDEDGHGVSSSRAGTASTGRVAVTFLKSMIGPFLLYLPKAFSIGGWGYGVAMLLLVATVSTYNMLLLIDCRAMSRARSYGGLGKHAMGLWGQRAVDFSLFTSQFAYCTTYFIFVADNMRMVLQEALGLKVSHLQLMLFQLCLYVPLSWIRKIKTLSKTMVFANACVTLGLMVVLGFDIQKIAYEGHLAPGVDFVKPDGVVLFTGSVVICFEGIGLVLPIRDMMAKPEGFKPLLITCMIGVAFFFASFGTLGYFAYGDGVGRFIVESVADDFRVPGSIAQVAYCAAVALTYPLMLFPAINVANRYLQHYGLWRESKTSTQKLVKNAMRTGLVVSSFGLAIGCGASFDNFVALVGAFCACPLALIYPIVFHYGIVGVESTWARLGHALLLLGGVAGMMLCLCVSILTWK